MKTNLKTFPTHQKFLDWFFKKLALAWKKEFEAELREMLERERYPEKGYCPVWDNAFDYAIKEILGE